MSKSAEELLNEIDEAQKTLAPDLFKEDDILDDETSNDKKALDNKDEENEDEKDYKLDDNDVSNDDKDEKDKVSSIDDLQIELKRLQSELNKEESARGRLKVVSEESQYLKEQIASLQKELNEIKESSKSTKDASVEDSLLQDLIETYGENSQAVKMYKTLNKRIQDITEKAETSVKKVEEKVVNVETSTKEKAIDDFYKKLTDNVEDWEEIVNEPEFSEFLKQSIPFTKKTLYDSLSEAAAVLDIETAIDIYQAFKDEYKSKKDDDSVDINDNSPSKSKKEKVLAPNTTTKGEIPKKQQEILSPDDVKKMTDKIYNLRIKGKNKEADLIQSKLDSFLDSLGYLT